MSTSDRSETTDVPAASEHNRFEMSRTTKPSVMITWAVVAVVVVGLPFLLSDFRVGKLTDWIILAIGATGLNLLTGYNGQISIGHGAFYGVGAYTTVLLYMRAEWPLALAVIAGAVLCFVAGVVVGLPALRIKGLYLAMVTLALATLFPFVAVKFKGVTGGAQGIAIKSQKYIERRKIWRTTDYKFEPPSIKPLSSLEDYQWRYFVFVIVLIVCLIVVRNIVRSRVGRSIVAIRDNEVAAAVSGIPSARTKIMTFGISAAIVGVAGGLFAVKSGQVGPTSFSVSVSIFFLVVVVLGGSATISGPIVGAVAYGLFNDFIVPLLPQRIQPLSMVIVGFVLAVQVLLAPAGLVGVFKDVKATLLARSHG